MEKLTVGQALSLSFAVGLGFVLGSFVGSFLQYLITNYAINPLLRNLVG